MGTDQGKENKQDGSERSDTGRAAATAARIIRVCDKQIQSGPLKIIPNMVTRIREAFLAIRRMLWLSSVDQQLLHRYS